MFGGAASVQSYAKVDGFCMKGKGFFINLDIKLTTIKEFLVKEIQHQVLCIPTKKYTQLSCCSSARERWTKNSLFR